MVLKPQNRTWKPRPCSIDYNVLKLLTFFIKTRKMIQFNTGNTRYNKYVCFFFFFWALKILPLNSFNLLVTTKKNGLESVLAKIPEILGDAVVRKYNNFTATGR